MTQDHHDCGDETVARVVHLTPVQADWLAETAAEFRMTECRFLQLLLGGYIGSRVFGR